MKIVPLREHLPTQMQDEVVVNRVLGGEKELFEILLRRYNQTLYRVIRGYLRDEEDVEDAMQNTYMKAFDKLQQFQGNAAFSTWLIRIGINEALLRLRRIKKSRSVYVTDVDVDGEKIIQLPDNKLMNPEKQAINLETRQLIEKAIDQLPEKYRIIYMLKEVEGMKNEEIASCLELSEPNVKVRLHRARTILKDTLYKISAGGEIFEFGNSRCDRVVMRVMGVVRGEW
ncbi:MAG TPA: RNA polymerase sigma factor [Cyclobacteriaceae bacterium]